MKGRGATVVVVLAAVSMALIALLQPDLATQVHKVKQRDDVFLLPPPAQLRAMTLGYRATVVDLLWAKLLIEHGMHSQERRPFPDVTRYVDGIIAVEPDFPTLYTFIDTLLVYNPTGGTEADARTARHYLELGTKARPHDPKVWMQYGQFIAFLAGSFLKDPAEIDRWRVDGALAMAHALELGADPSRSLAVASILDKAGKEQAVIGFTERMYAMTDDPDLKQQYLMRLAKMRASSQAEQSASAVEREWRTKYRFLRRGEALLIGPTRSPAACAGTASYTQKACMRDWTQVVEAAR